MTRTASPITPAPDLSDVVNGIVTQYGDGPEMLIPILHALQSELRFLPDEALLQVARRTRSSMADIEGVVSFYTQFRRTPVGKHLIVVCHGTACHVKGAGRITDALRRALKLPEESSNAGPELDTDADGLFTITQVACLGCCTLAPVIQIDGITYGHLTAETTERALQDFLDLQKSPKPASKNLARSARGKILGEVRVGSGSCCVAGGSLKVRRAIEEEAGRSGRLITIKSVGCVGMCHQTPLVEIITPDKPKALYTRATAGDARTILNSHFPPRGPVRRIGMALAGALDRMLPTDQDRPAARSVSDRDPQICAFLGPQKHVVTEYCGEVGPLDLDDYQAHDGFAALKKVLTENNPQGVVETMQRSGLRGRGGAGFPTGRKWEAVRNAPGDQRILICNGDEGDPGAFMDRMLLESYPFRVIEGMSIAAHTVGAHEGIFYIRAEYQLAVKRVKEAIHLCEERGILGDRLMGSAYSLHLRVMEGAGAFVCGEETALIASLEGKRGIPTLRPPYPAEKGLHGLPTLINNVETYASVPWILCNGPEAFSAMGTGKSRGTKVFALTGKIRRGGLIEVPMGVTVRQIVDEIGGGVAEGRRFKAVQIGGPSGGCVPAELGDTPIDYEALAQVGAIMGSGGLVVLDDEDCMVEIARYFLAFTQDQSCGKCTFCRIGTRRMLELLNRLCVGEGKAGDLEELELLASQIKAGSLCGLGQTAPNPVITTLRYFREEYLAHLEGRCPAGKCKALIQYQISDSCVGCTLCAQQCPVGAIPFTPYRKHTINPNLCTRCDLCRSGCPEKAISVVSGAIATG